MSTRRRGAALRDRIKQLRRARVTSRLMLALGVGAAVAGATATSALAEGMHHLDPEQFALDSFTTSSSDMRAGAHPDVGTVFSFKSAPVADGHLAPFGRARRIEIDMPNGLVGDPTAFPACTMRDFYYQGQDRWPCAPETQVGTARLLLHYIPGLDQMTLPIYNLERGPDEPVLLGIKIPTFIHTFIRVENRPDGGLTAIIDDIAFNYTLVRSDVTLWGVPADSNPLNVNRDWPRVPFMTGPTQCDTIPTTRIRVWSYEGKFDEAEHSLDTPPTHCDEVPFSPSMTARPTSRAAAGPTGLDVTIDAPQDQVDGRVPAHINQVRIALPEGMSVSPSSANGLAACSPAEFGYRTKSAVTCPDASKIGTVSLKTPLLEQPMSGSVFLAKQNDNPFNSLLALYIVLEGTGIQVKLAGRVDPDPITGRLTTTFNDNPQLPFERLELSLKSGPRAPLVNPQTCGTYQSDTSITSWTRRVVSASTPMTIDQDCKPVGFNPSFEAGAVDPVGGASSPFTLTFARGDHDQELRDITVDMPEGLTGKIADAVLCSNAIADAGACGEGSRIGSVTTSAGVGSEPYFLPGRVYITEGYKGAPFGMSIVVPAVAGPFDLGNVVVRAAIHVDRRSAKLRVISDPMPRILQGIVLKVRSVNVAIDKPGFMINPTSCNAKQVHGQIRSHQGGVADRSTRFQVGGCGALPIKPKMVLTVGARGKTQVDRRTPFTARLTMPRGQGNLRQVDVVLPKTLNGRLDVIQRDRACTMAQFEADRCANVIGQGVATTPLLRDPLRGPAYFLYNPDRRLPDIVVRLRGQVDIDLVGKVTIPRDLTLRTSFDTVPDVPVNTFTLRLNSGRTNGPIGVVRNLCTREGRSGRARIAFIGHNGRRTDVQQKLRIQGCGRKAQSRRAARRQARREQARRSAAKRASVRAAKADAGR